LEDRYYRPSSALDPFWQCLICSFRTAPVANAKAAVVRIETLTGIRLSESQCRRVMKKMGMSLKKSAPIPGKADGQLQFEFYQTQLQPRLEEARAGQRKVFFVDAAHFVLGAFLGLVWCFTRPLIKTASGRQRYNVLGAIDSHSKELISIRNTGYIDGGVVCLLLAAIRTRHPSEAITLVLDNARYQRCVLVMDKAHELGIELLFLPAYSPNLNLIERLWKLVKKRCLTNKYYPDFSAFRGAIDHCLDNLNGPARRELDLLLTLKFQFFQTSKT
jgi:transposase